MSNSNNGNAVPKVATRAILGTYRLVDQLFGVRAYQIRDGERPLELKLSKSDALTVFYEVAPSGQGAWWLPTSTVEDPSWGGCMPLKAEGYIPTTCILRPTQYFLWIPRQNLGSIFRPVTVLGQVEGELPTGPPPADHDPHHPS